MTTKKSNFINLGGMCAAGVQTLYFGRWGSVLQLEHQIDLTFRSDGHVVLLVEYLFAVQCRYGKLLYY